MAVVDFSFAPSAKRAELLNKNMHMALHKSLVYIKSELQNTSNNSYSSIYDHNKLNNIIKLLENNYSLPPEAFGWYYHLVFSIYNQDQNAINIALDKLSNIQSVLSKSNLMTPLIRGLQPRALTAGSTNKTSINITNFGEPYIYSEKPMYMKRLGEYLNFDFTPVDIGPYSQFKNNLETALIFIKNHIPELYSEIENLISDIYIVNCPDYKYEINGAAVFQLWRLLFLKVKLDYSPIKLIETFAHEAAHIYLFGHTIKEPLTLNNKNELYYSPFRKVNRPIDGIYHGVFVSARVCFAMTEILNSNTIVAKHEVEQILAENYDNFQQGYEVIQRYGKLSETGTKLMQAACEYMEKNIISQQLVKSA